MIVFDISTILIAAGTTGRCQCENSPRGTFSLRPHGTRRYLKSLRLD